MESKFAEGVAKADCYRRRWLDEKVIGLWDEQKTVAAVERCTLKFLEKVKKREDVDGDVRGALEYILTRTRSEEEEKNWGLLETTLVCDTHRVLLGGLDKTRRHVAGRLSDRPRYVVREGGAKHWYPCPDDMGVALTSLVDEYNIRYDRHRCTYEDMLETCAWFTFRFLSLHPFGDGNGRLCQILCNYSMSLHHPFPVAFCDTDEFVSSLIKAQDSGDILPLAVDIATTTRLAWRSFLGDDDRRSESTD